MTPHQAKQYFFNRIRIQILKAQADRGRWVGRTCSAFPNEWGSATNVLPLDVGDDNNVIRRRKSFVSTEVYLRNRSTKWSIIQVPQSVPLTHGDRGEG